MTWSRAELLRRLLEWAHGACDVYSPGLVGGDCSNCGWSYGQHLAKHAAEDIGVLDARKWVVALVPVRQDTVPPGGDTDR